MESKDTSDGDNKPTSTLAPPMKVDVESNSSLNKQDDFDRIVGEVTGEGAVNVNNTMQQPLSRVCQDSHVYTTDAGQQFPANQSIGLQYHMFPQRMPLQLAAARQQVPANQNYGVQGFISPQGIPFPLAGQARAVARGRRTPQALIKPTRPSRQRYPALVSPPFHPPFMPSDFLRGNFRQSQTTAPVQPPTRLALPTAPVYTYDPIIPISWAMKLVMASDSGDPSSSRSIRRPRVRPSFNISANQSLPIPPSRTAKSQTDLSAMYTTAQATVSIPTDHIKQDFDEPPEPSGRECFLCKRDLSFTPAADGDGPIFQPRRPPPVAVLPCGHYFHDRCLEIVTPPKKSKEPPCIICDLDESAS